MNNRIVIAIVTLTLLAGMILLTGCNTWHGAGKDVKRTGEKMQD